MAVLHNSSGTSSRKSVLNYLSAENLARLQASKDANLDFGRDKWKNVFLRVFTPEQGNQVSVKVYCHNLTSKAMLNSGFKPERKTKVLIHGYQSDSSDYGQPFVNGSNAARSN